MPDAARKIEDTALGDPREGAGSSHPGGRVRPNSRRVSGVPYRAER